MTEEPWAAGSLGRRRIRLRVPQWRESRAFSQEAIHRRDRFGKSEAVARGTDLANPQRSAVELRGCDLKRVSAVRGGPFERRNHRSAARNEAASASRTLRLVVLRRIDLVGFDGRSPWPSLAVVRQDQTAVFTIDVDSLLLGLAG